MQTSIIESALRRLGEIVAYHREIELLLVGGAAGMLTGILPPSRITIDCDVMVYTPEAAMPTVELAAELVAREMHLHPRWLNSDVQLRVDALPDGWERRRILVGQYGQLHVWAASRPDLIAMKVLAGREQDVEDLLAMRLRRDDVDFVRGYFNSLAAKGTRQNQIEIARALLESLETHDP